MSANRQPISAPRHPAAQKAYAPQSLALFNGGPLDEFLERLGIGGDSPRQKFRQIALWVAISWIPLLAFSYADSLQGGPKPQVSFWADFSIHLRLLIALPLLIASEHYVRIRVDNAPQLLAERGIIRAELLPALAATEARIRSLRDSAWVEFAILAFTVALILSRSMIDLPQKVDSWRNLGTPFSDLASGWFHSVGLVIYVFFVLRWFWRYCLWNRFLLRLATLDLNLQCAHPDTMGGLGFLVQRHFKFVVMCLPVSIVASANIAGRLLYAMDPIESWVHPIIAFICLALLFFLAPLAVFTPLLARSKWEGMHHFGNFGNRCTTSFEKKWFGKEPNPDLDPIEGPDISSMNDLMGTYSHVQEMKLFPIDRRLFLGMIYAVAVPFLPLILFKIPLYELIASLKKLVF